MPGSGSGSGVSAGDLTVKWASGVSSLQDFLVLHPESDGSDQTAFSELLRGVFFSCFFVPLSILSLPYLALSTGTVSLISIKCIVWYSGLTDIFNLSNCCINICVNDSFELVTAASLLRLWDSWTPPQPSAYSVLFFLTHILFYYSGVVILISNEPAKSMWTLKGITGLKCGLDTRSVF